MEIMEKLIKLLQKPKKEKLLHFFYYTLLFFIINFVFKDLSFVIILVIAFTEQVINNFKRKTFDVVTMIYSLIVPALILLI